MVYHPKLMFFSRKVSNPGSLVFFLWMVSNPVSLAPELQEDWLGTKDEIGSSNIHLYNSNLHLIWCHRKYPGHGTRIARGLDWYNKNCQHKYLYLLSCLSTGATRDPGHGTRIARGVPLPVYVNLDVYSGFWCTSRCVVF